MNAFVKKQDIGGIKKISAEDIQNSFFNEGLEDEYKTQVKSQKKSNSRERLVKKMINESEGPNFDKLYKMFTRMTEEEFVMLESVILSSNSVFNEQKDSDLTTSNHLLDYLKSLEIKNPDVKKNLKIIIRYLVDKILIVNKFSNQNMVLLKKQIDKI